MCWWRDEADRWNVGTMDREPAGRRAPYHRSIVPSFRSGPDRKSTRLNSSHLVISYAVFCLKKKKSSVLYRTAEYRLDHLMDPVHSVALAPYSIHTSHAISSRRPLFGVRQEFANSS